MGWLTLAVATAAAFGAYNLFMKLAADRMDRALGAALLQLARAALAGVALVTAGVALLSAGGR